MTESQAFAFLLVEDFTHLAFSCAIEPLRIANLVAGRDLYRWSFLSEDGKGARSSNGCVTQVDRGFEPLGRDERLFVVAGTSVERRATPEILAYLRREKARGRRIGAICSGAHVLAEAGFLDGVEMAIHWGYHDLMAERFPEVRLRPSVFVAGPRFDTASGGTAAADLMLHLIGRAQGQDLATEIADQMVYSTVREGPARQLERIFDRHLGTSPKRYAMELRLDWARNLIVQTEQSVAEIAMASGFTSTSHFSRVFRAKFGISPGAQRAWLT